jgi:Meiotically up-regulated gene 113
MDKQHILEEIRRTAAANNGEPLGVARFFQETGIKETDWRGKFWVRWGEALREAGFEPNQLQQAYPDGHLLEKIVSLIHELKHFPVRAELKMKAYTGGDFPSPNAFARLGSKRQIAEKILSYCDKHGGHEDVVALCTPIASKDVSRDRTDTSTTENGMGFVYLMKSGAHYKIGRSNAAGRREYEISIQMPEKLTTVHTISTDDPVGIEAYWHKRFEANRKNGEWFDLSAADVKAFRRRKFM